MKFYVKVLRSNNAGELRETIEWALVNELNTVPQRATNLEPESQTLKEVVKLKILHVIDDYRRKLTF